MFVQSAFTVQVVSKSFLEIDTAPLFFDSMGLPILKLLKDGSYIPLVGLAKIF
ncbi:MAG: hypothetical protein LBH96_02530 [Candidatus Peribacteria bacterium]|nr:hypothetical protein [Candidatus Peribacteria bacterium]